MRLFLETHTHTPVSWNRPSPSWFSPTTVSSWRFSPPPGLSVTSKTLETGTDAQIHTVAKTHAHTRMHLVNINININIFAKRFLVFAFCM